jgi:hypothetical protein
MSKMILESMEGKRAGSDLLPNSDVAPEPVKGGMIGSGGGAGGWFCCWLKAAVNAAIAASVSGVNAARGVRAGSAGSAIVSK